MIYRVTKQLYRALCILLFVLPVSAVAQQIDTFVIEDIRIEGLQRASPAVVFNLLPVGIGESLSPDQAVEIIQQLYETGYFRDVNILREGNVLVVQVNENPTIAEVTVSGANELSDDVLTEMLQSGGIAKSKVFNQSLVEEAVRVIEGAYVERNFYHAEVEAVVSPLPRNRIALLFNVNEGAEAAIRSIRLIGNDAFSDWRLNRDMRLEPRSLFNFYTDNYRYSQEKLESDLARVSTRYLEAGYLRFEVESSQVEVSPDKRFIDVVIHLNEGEQYTISGTRFEAVVNIDNLPFDLDTLNQYVEQAPGDVYSGRLAGKTVQNIRNHLGNLGYVSAWVNQETNINDEDASAELVYLINPRKVVYVRRINIVGNELTADEIIRRELLQFETERYSYEKVRRSRSRIRRLGYFERVLIETVPIQGNDEQVDLLVLVEETYTGQVRFGAGFGTDGGLSYNAGFSNTNIFGSGNDFNVDINKTEDALNFNFQLDEHYYTKDGVTRHIGVNYGETESVDAASEYDYDGYKIEYGFDFPFTDSGIYNLYAAYENVDVKNIRNPINYQPFLDEHGEEFDALLLDAGLVYDTRDASRLPTEGQRLLLTGEVAVPLLDLEYFQLDYLHDYYYTAVQLPSEPVLHLKAGAGYGDGYGSGEYPFYKRYHLGGTRTLRGFAAGAIGHTTDSSGDAVGGKSRLYGTAELSIDPQIFEEQQVFLVPFVDVGAVGKDNIALGSIRSSLGLEVRWLSPVGPLRFIYATAVNSSKQDSLESFQFSVSTF